MMVSYTLTGGSSYCNSQVPGGGDAAAAVEAGAGLVGILT